MSVTRIAGHATAMVANTPQTVAMVDVRAEGNITALTMSLRAEAALDGAGEYLHAELSFASTPATSDNVVSNDTRQSIAFLQLANNGAAAPTGKGAENLALSGLRIPVSSGDRVYLHVYGAVSTTALAVAYLYIEDNYDDRLRRR